MERFDLDRLRPGSRDSFALPVMRLPDGNDLWLPVLAAAGLADGPTLAVLAGVHGDEYEGIRAIPQIFRALDLAQLRGRLPTLVGYPHADTPHGRASRAAALAFGCDVLWGHPPDPTAGGRTISAAEALGIPWIYTEAAGGGRTLPKDVECYRSGVLNAMRHLGMLPGQPEIQPLRCHLLGAGNTDAPIRVDTSGYFVSEVDLLAIVTAGQAIGYVLDFAGEPLETIRAHADGRVVMIRGIPAVHAGDGVFLLSGELRQV